MKRGFKTLLEEAQSSVGSCSIDKARAMLGDSDVVFVDVRDDKELETHGWILRAVHASRGMLEFYLDPESPFHKPQLTRGKLLVFYCGSGWRSVLSAARAKEMGIAHVTHIEAGLNAWKSARGPIEWRD